jgi:hypothetical protein
MYVNLPIFAMPRQDNPHLFNDSRQALIAQTQDEVKFS